MIDFGETYSSDNFEVRDASGVLADAGTINNPAGVQATITLPDGTTVNPTLTKPATGIYVFDFLTSQAGRHLVMVSATGGVLGSLVRRWVDAFVVRPANPATAISLRDAKAYLNEQSNLQDEEIRAYLECATEIAEKILGGPLSVRSYTERVRNGTWCFKLMRTPIVSVTSVTSIRTPSTTYVTADLDVDQDYGIVYLKNGTDFINGPWTAVYQAGRAQLDSRHETAVKDLLWHMWTLQRGQLADTTAPDLVEVTDFETRGAFAPGSLGFLIPHYVREKLEFDTVPGLA